MACCDEIEVVSTDLVSIVLPVFNTADYLSTCIESLLCQTYPNIEIVIVDDGSSDGSSDIFITQLVMKISVSITLRITASHMQEILGLVPQRGRI